MTGPRETATHLAVHCHHLLPTSVRNGEPVNVCSHPARDGRACVGPFLHDLPTTCGLWEPHPQKHLIAAPVPDRWRGRRRGGYDTQRGW